VKWRILPLLGAAVVAALGVGLFTGATGITPAGVWAALLDGSAPDAAIVRQLRLPRVIMAFLVGGTLAVTGATLQALIRNPLADPYLLGLSGGAGVGAVIAMSLGLSGAWAVPLAAFAGALGAVALVYRLSAVTGRRLDPRVLILAGVVVGAFAAAIMTAIITLARSCGCSAGFRWPPGRASGCSQAGPRSRSPRCSSPAVGSTSSSWAMSQPKRWESMSTSCAAG
jgi:iron complex transport system permease protein